MKLAVISDIHEDLNNLTKALRMIEKAGCDEIACLGDITGFSIPFYKYHNTRNANECIRLIAENAKYVVAGNHDHYAIRKLPQHIPGFNLPDNWYALPFEKRKEISKGQLWLYEENELSALLNDKSSQWLSQLPEKICIQAGEFQILFSHFLYPDITGITTKFLTNIRNFQPHREFMKSLKVDLSLFGHTHQAGLLVVRNIVTELETTKKASLNSTTEGIGIPAIASSSGYSGFAILNTIKKNITTRSINSVFKISS